MTLYVLSYKRKPITVKTIKKKSGVYTVGTNELPDEKIYAALSQAAVRKAFLYDFGFTWEEWKNDGLYILPFEVKQNN